MGKINRNSRKIRIQDEIPSFLQIFQPKDFPLRTHAHFIERTRDTTHTPNHSLADLGEFY